MEDVLSRMSNEKAIQPDGDAHKFRESVRELIDGEVKKILDEELKNATKELIEEHRKAIKHVVEESKLIIREVVEEEKKAIWARAEALRKSIYNL